MDVDAGYVEFATARGPALFRTAWLLTGDWHLAEDLTQEALGRIYARWSRVAAAEQPAAYAHTVLVNAFLSHRRRRSSGERPADRAGLDDRAVTDADIPLRLDCVTRWAGSTGWTGPSWCCATGTISTPRRPGSWSG